MQSVQSRENRILSTSSNNSTNSISNGNQVPLPGRLMSISSIIAAPPMYPSSSLTTLKKYHKESMERRASAPSHPYSYPKRYNNTTSAFRSPPTSPDDKLFESSTPSSPTSSVASLSPKRPSYQQQNSYQREQQNKDIKRMLSTENDQDEIMLNDQNMGHPPLTLQERRLRNKAASAKYRQKKNHQQNEMRVMIGRLSEQNAVLERQLQELRLENERLKATTDRLRGKMVAKKMLKKWIGRQSLDGNNYQQPIFKNNSTSEISQHQFAYNSNSSNEKNSNFNYIALNSKSEHDDGMNVAVATIPSDQDEDDELESINSD